MCIRFKMGNFIISGGVSQRLGCLSGAITEAAWVDWISGAEAVINSVTRRNWSTDYSTLNPETKHILTDTAASLVGINATIFDMSGYPTRIEAEDTINVLRDSALRNMSILRDKKEEDF